MVHNFESWRKAKQASYDNAPFMHYHRCSDLSLAVVTSFLSRLLKQRVEQNRYHFVITLSDAHLQEFMEFLDEMHHAYLHPRSTSARLEFRNLSNPTC